MSKHIHLHIHRARQRAADAGFDESKHKRDAGGRFSTSSGNANYHLDQAEHHRSEAAKPGTSPEQKASHERAASHHSNAGAHLKMAEMKHGDGNSKSATSYHEAAENEARAAALHAMRAGPKKDAATSQRESDLRMAQQHLEAAEREKQAGNTVSARHHMELHKKFKAVAEGAPRDAATGGSRNVNEQPAPAAKRAAAPKGFKKGSEGHLEASAKERAGHLANRKAAAAHLEAAGFQPDRANNKHKTFGTGAHAQEEQHFAYKHPDGRTASVVHVTTGWAGGGFTKIKHA